MSRGKNRIVPPVARCRGEQAQVIGNTGAAQPGRGVRALAWRGHRAAAPAPLA
ncbi:hypothetical protein M8756_06320 [Lutimaribacter sp. EGI FJ00015]|nr:hypothetical protein [Lutimaribacter sp. EGI FJ00015]MCO0635574.1 hypothetical protein [Lutimaribacter sp. EGI FJ00014]